MARRALLFLLLLFPAPVGSAAGEGPRAPDPEPRTPVLKLIVDHLPAFLYCGEKLAYSFRVERRQGVKEKPAFKLSWRFLDARGRKLAPASAEREAGQRFTIVRGFLPVPRKARRFEFELRADGKRLGSGGARFVGEKQPWPAGARAAWGGLASEEGERLILVLEERVAEVDDRWKPIKWIWRRGQRRATNVVLVGPRLTAEGGKSYQDLLAGSAPKLKIFGLPPVPASRPEAGKQQPTAGDRPAQGIYRLVEMVESRVRPAARGPDLVVVACPPSDPEMATNPRRYRQGLDWILSRLKLAGAPRLALLPPLSKRVPAKQLAAYTRLAREAAKVYKARFLEPAGVLKDARWVPGGAKGRVTGRWPNGSGQKALAALVRTAYK